MRSNQHKNRQRSRGRSRGSSSNRVYESNGPDVKVRGTAQHVAEKYLQLGRDAQASGDTVMSESYFQHAEHYLRIVAANQPPQQQQSNAQSYGNDDDYDDDDGDSRDIRETSRETRRDNPPPPGSGPQPDIAGRETSSRSNGANGASHKADDDKPEDVVDSWAGPQPGFLQKPVTASSETTSEEPAKPKRARAPRQRRTKAADAESKAAGGDEGTTGESETAATN